MTTGDVVTRSNRGQWENSVQGRPELSQSFGSRDEAIEAGNRLAKELGVEHIVRSGSDEGVSADDIF